MRTSLLIGCLAISAISFAQNTSVCYPFNGNANDLSGNNNNASSYQTSYVEDRNGNSGSAAFFNGVSSVQFYGGNVHLNDFTWSVWFKFPTYPGSGTNYTILSNGGGDADQVLNVTNDDYTGQHQIMFTTYDSQKRWTRCYSDFIPEVNTWYHVVVSRTNSKVTMHINGEFDSESDIVNPANAGYVGSGSDYAYIGVRVGNYQNFVGQIDDLRIYEGVYTPVQLSSGECGESGTGISDYSTQPSLHFYHQPESRTLVLPEATDNFVVTDIAGNVLIKGNSGSKVNTSTLATGIYVVKFTSSGVVGTGKFFVN